MSFWVRDRVTPVIEVISVLIEKYEDEHVLELS